MAKKPVPSIDLLVPSANVIRQHAVVYFVLAVIPLLLVSYGTLTAKTVTELLTSPVLGFGWMLHIVFHAPLTYAMTRSSAGKQVSLAESLTVGYRYFWRLVGLNLVVGLLVLLGLICFVIPGFIILKRYFLASYLLVDKDLGVGETMRQSVAQSSHFGSAIYGVMFISLLFGLFGMVSIVGTIVGTLMQFLYSVAPALRYHELKKLQS